MPSGSAYEGNFLVRDESNTVLLFENPWQNQLPEDESTRIVYNTELKALKTDDSVDNILEREFREL